MGRTSSYCKQTLVAFLVYALVLMPSLAFASAKNYNVKTLTYDPLERVIRATTLDRIAEKTMQRSARVPVTAMATGSTVASMIRMGIAGAIVYGIVEGAGWIIENGIVYKPKEFGEFYYMGNSNKKYSTAKEAIKEISDYWGVNFTFTSQGQWLSYSGNTIYYSILTYTNVNNGSIINPRIYRYGETKQTKEPVPDNELGNQINNSPKAPQVLPEVYNPNNPAGGPAPESTADAIDRSAPEPEKQPTGNTKPKPNVDTNGDGIPDTYDPSAPTAGEEFELPAFCEWATTMCQWYEKYIDDSKKTDEAREKEQTHREKQLTFWEKVEDWFKKWDDKPEQDDDTELEIPVPETPNIDSDISFGGDCPAPLSAPYSFLGISGSMEFSFAPVCQIASFIKPVVITISAFSAALIVAGIRTEDD